MSCFIHEDKTFDRLLVTFKNLNNKGYGLFKTPPLDLIKQLRDYNIQAFKERYQGRHSEDIPGDYTVNTTALPYTPIEAFKILNSIDYQCIDCSNYIKSETRNQLEKLQLYFATTIISQLPDYANAAWS